MKKLNCPYCNQDIVITWKCYISSTLRTYKCPQCNEKSKIVTNPNWIQYSSWTIQAALLIALFSHLEKDIYTLILLLLLIFVLPVDKYLDAKYGLLVKK